MAIPSVNNLVFYTNKPLDDNDWKTNWTQLVSWLTGTANVTFDTVTASTSVTAPYFIGDGSLLTNTTSRQRNWLINAGATVNQGSPVSLDTDYVTQDNFWYGYIANDSGGDFGITSSASCGRSGYAFQMNSSSGTSRTAYLRYRMKSGDAVNFISQKASFSCRVFHNDPLLNLAYTVTIRKANAVNDFTGVTDISVSSALTAVKSTDTLIYFDNVSMGSCGNGIEIEIKISLTNSVTYKLEFTELQFELSTGHTAFDYTQYELQYNLMNSIPDDVYTKCKTVLSGNQTVTSGALTVVEFNTATFDTRSEFDTSGYKFIANRAGYYNVHVNLRYDTASGAGIDSQFQAIIYKNTNVNSGVTIPFVSTIGITGGINIQLTDLVYLNGTTDYIQIKTLTTYPVSCDLLSGATNTNLTITRVL